MITRLELEHFKAFDQLDLSLRPITLLLGPNNSGKSSIIAALRILMQTIDSNDRFVPLLLNGRFGDFGTYRDVVFGNHRGRPISIAITFSPPPTPQATSPGLRFLPAQFKDDIRLLLDFKYRTRRREIILRGTELRIGGRTALATRYSEETERQLVERLAKSQVPTPIKSSISRVLRMNNFVPYFSIGLGTPSSRGDTATSEFLQRQGQGEIRILSRVARAIAMDLQAIDYIGPLRASPSRTYLFTGERRKRIGLSGENAVNMMAMDAQARRSGQLRVAELISMWLERAQIGARVSINPLSDRHYEIRVEHPITHESENLADIGYGISQVLPVLTGGYSLAPGSTYLIEEPEIHLHPRAQGELGSFLADLYERGVHTLVETHSEYLVLRLQQYVAQGRIPPSDISIIYVYPADSGKVAKHLSIDENGVFTEEWPEGFFPERLDEARNLAKARRGESGG